MTLERCQHRFAQLLDVAQDEALCEAKFAEATSEPDKQLAMINLIGAREARNALLRKWGLYPAIT